MEYQLKNQHVFYVLTNQQPIIQSTNEASEDEIFCVVILFWKHFDSLFNQFAKKPKICKGIIGSYNNYLQG